MASSLGPQQREWKRTAESKGWRVVITANQHLLFVPPEGEPITVPGRGFKENRGLPNARSRLRRAGLDV